MTLENQLQTKRLENELEYLFKCLEEETDEKEIKCLNNKIDKAFKELKEMKENDQKRFNERK